MSLLGAGVGRPRWRPAASNDVTIGGAIKPYPDLDLFWTSLRKRASVGGAPASDGSGVVAAGNYAPSSMPVGNASSAFAGTVSSMATQKPKIRSLSRKRKRFSRAHVKSAAPPAATKRSACLALLERPEGATIGELQEITGWQTHSVRAFIAGTVKRKLGLSISSTNEVRGRVYHLLRSTDQP
jgi:hypothetical protein